MGEAARAAERHGNFWAASFGADRKKREIREKREFAGRTLERVETWKGPRKVSHTEPGDACFSRRAGRTDTCKPAFGKFSRNTNAKLEKGTSKTRCGRPFSA